MQQDQSDPTKSLRRMGAVRQTRPVDKHPAATRRAHGFTRPARPVNRINFPHISN